MGRRKNTASFKIVGKTPEGRLVIGNVYAFYETHGLPLSDMLFQMWSNYDHLPDWVELVNDMMKAGRPLNRTMEAVMAAAHDACYPPHMIKGIIERLKCLHADLEDRANSTQRVVE